MPRIAIRDADRFSLLRARFVEASVRYSTFRRLYRATGIPTYLAYAVNVLFINMIMYGL